MEFHMAEDVAVPMQEQPQPETPQAPVLTANALIASMAAFYAEDVTHWAKGALALVGQPDATAPGGVRYVQVEPEAPNVTAFSIAGLLRSYLQNQPEAVVREASQRIFAAAAEWWARTYGEAFPMPTDLQALNDHLNPTTLQTILGAARGLRAR